VEPLRGPLVKFTIGRSRPNLKGVTEPAFSVIVPAYNAASTLASAIESVLAQSWQDFELIVVDDGSGDGTLGLARRYTTDPRVSVIHQENRGLPAARNAGITQARARYVSLLDSDDLLLPSYLVRMAEALEAHPAAGFAYTDAWALDGRAKRIRRATAMARLDPPENPPADPPGFLRLLVRRNFIFAGATIRLAALQGTGGFNETLRAAEDYELWLRMLAHGHAAVRVPGPLAVKRVHPGAMSQDPERMYEALDEVWRLVSEEHPAPPDVRVRARELRVWAQSRRDAVHSRSLSRRVARAVRARLGALHRRLDWRLTYRTPPPEVAEAFPDLEQI
jgi:glycosyltransferase involved in cell wall biosynthesis